jgi:hypothetical protein
MSSDPKVVREYFQMKDKLNAAYTLFKVEPTVSNVAQYTAAVQTFNTYCKETLARLMGDVPADSSAKKQEILDNIEDYQNCTQCGKEVLFLVDPEHYITNIDFMEDFPGWCFGCLRDHCRTTNCEACDLRSDSTKCSFKTTKELISSLGA